MNDTAEIDDTISYWGRPELPPGAHQDQTVTVQVRAEMKADWRAAADEAGVSLAEWVRRCVARTHGRSGAAASAPPARADLVDRARSIDRQIAVVGNNLNLLAHRISTATADGRPATAALVDDVLDEVADMTEAMHALSKFSESVLRGGRS